MGRIDTKSDSKIRTSGGGSKEPRGDRGDRSDRGDRDRGGDRDGGKDEGFGQWRRRARPAADLVFDFKHPETIAQFLGDDGRIVPARVSRLNRRQQNELAQAIKRARHLALIPVSARHTPLGRMIDNR